MRAKTSSRVYENCNQTEANSEEDEIESNLFEEKVLQRWRYKDKRQENLITNVEDSKSDVKVVPEGKKSKSLAGDGSKAIKICCGVWTSSRQKPARYGGNDEQTVETTSSSTGQH